MSKSTDVRLAEVSCSTQHIDYRAPLKFGGRVVADVVLFDVSVTVESRDGRRGQGGGSMPVGNVWGWPSQQVSVDQSLAAMIEFGERLVQRASEFTDVGHPLELTHTLSQHYASDANEVTTAAGSPEPMPKLAQLVAASPLEAAIHDAFGKMLGQNSYNVLGSEFANTDLSTYLTDEFAGEYLDRYTSRDPKPTMPLYHLVGALDALTDGDINTRLDDGFPETLAEWIVADGLTHFKVKLAGDDLQWDVQRVVATEQVVGDVQSSRGVAAWHYSLDFNEKCPNVEYLLEFLQKVEEQSPTALPRVQYIEQPTHRDLRANPENKMHEAARIKPVVIDESLVDFESLLLAREQGYSGIALKACKGQTEALLMGAAAQKYGMFLCVQDLTCIGASFLHSASLAARIPTVAAIEGNGRQFCPRGNDAWVERFPRMFNISDGTVGTAELDGPGLGF